MQVPQPPPPKAKAAERESAVAAWTAAFGTDPQATRPDGAGFQAQREGASEEGQEREVSGTQCPETFVVPTDPSVDGLRRQAGEVDLGDPALQFHSKAAPPVRMRRRPQKLLSSSGATKNRSASGKRSKRP